MIVGVLAYIALVLFLRISGKRTLSKWNAFDFVVTVALGSTLATILLSKDVPLIEGLVAFALLIFLQFSVTFLSVRSPRVRTLVKAQPALLFYRGEYLRDALKNERIPEEEIRAAVRNRGFGTMGQVDAVVLETDGSFAVIASDKAGDLSALSDVRKPAQGKGDSREF